MHANYDAQNDVIRLNEVLAHLKTLFIGKDDIIDLMGICLASRENLFLLGPPGTAKSAVVRALATLIDGNCFEYLLTRFTEPNEIFGPFDIRRLREGELTTNTEGMLPEADLIFLDELLNANSAILNSLLMALNERIFRRGRETRTLPVLMSVGASNHLPEDEALKALFDRFLMRVRSENVAPDQLPDVLEAGWRLERNTLEEAPNVTVEAIKNIQKLLWQVALDDIKKPYLELVMQLRNAGVPVSDRRAVKLQRLIAASALLSGRMQAQVSDLWVLRYIWETEEQIAVIEGMVNRVVDTDPVKTQQHPRASRQSMPDPEELMHDIQKLSARWDHPDTTFPDRAAIKDQLRFINNRAAWITNAVSRDTILQHINTLWQKILHSEAL